ncbi:hypothetical protein HPB51_024471 [Rhipicephalus microplus]|uniref:Uncharacterized protein n=1 Tax=Rhipicephalus microplus TaxID=6941 RepID=A0A9J6EJG9_RHIMP|nr:hypothetical protein HPB51_024471 [Rhipicephalus microplus]
MAFTGIAPPDLFLPTLGRPVQPWFRWHDMFKVYLPLSGASEFSPERRKALLLHSLGPEGQRIFNTLSILQAAEQTEEEGTGAAPDVYDSAVAALAKHFDATCNLVVERHRFHRRIQFPGRKYSFHHDPGDTTLLAATWQPASAETSAPAAKPVPSADYDSRSPARPAAGQFPASETVSHPPVNTTEEPVVSFPPGRRIQPHHERRRPDRYG